MSNKIPSIKPVSSVQIASFKNQLQALDSKKFSGIKNSIQTFFSSKKKLSRRIIKKAVKKAAKIKKKDFQELSEIVEILDRHREKLKHSYQAHPEDELEEVIKRIGQIIASVLPKKNLNDFEPYTYKKAVIELNDFFLGLSELDQTNFMLKKNQTDHLLNKAKTAAKRKQIVEQFVHYVKKVIG